MAYLEVYSDQLIESLYVEIEKFLALFEFPNKN